MKMAKKLIDTAQKWNGYLEKKSNKELDSFTENAGKWYWFNGDGYVYRCQWVQYKGRWYYLALIMPW